MAKKERDSRRKEPALPAPTLGLPGLAALRKKAGLTQDALAKKLDRDETAISHWENGKGGPPSGELPCLAAVLGCSIDDLFREAQAS